MGWIKIRAIRKEAVFSAKIGEIFNIESKTGIENWNDVKFLVSIPEYESNGGFVDTRLSIDEKQYPNFEVVNKGDFLPNLNIDVFVTEGDMDTINKTGSTWKKTFSLDKSIKKALYTLSPNNNHAVKLPDSFSGNYKLFFSFKRTVFPKNMFSYKILPQISNKTLTLSVTSKMANIKSQSSSSRTISIKSPMFCGVTFMGNTIGPSGPDTPSITSATFEINGTRKTVPCTATFGWGFQVYTCDTIYYYAEKNKIIDYNLNFLNMSDGWGVSNSMMSYFYCNTSDYTTEEIKDVELNCLVVWGL